MGGLFYLFIRVNRRRTRGGRRNFFRIPARVRPVVSRRAGAGPAGRAVHGSVHHRVPHQNHSARRPVAAARTSATRRATGSGDGRKRCCRLLFTSLPVAFICAIPATYLSVSWKFTLPLIVDKQMDFAAAMKASWKMVNKHWWLVFGLVILISTAERRGSSAPAASACCSSRSHRLRGADDCV